MKSLSCQAISTIPGQVGYQASLVIRSATSSVGREYVASATKHDRNPAALPLVRTVRCQNGTTDRLERPLGVLQPLVGRTYPMRKPTHQERTTRTAPTATMAAPTSFRALIGSTGDASHP